MSYDPDTLVPYENGKNELWFLVIDYIGRRGLRAKLEDIENVYMKKERCTAFSSFHAIHLS
jgi:hypothetical protein